MDDYSKIGHTSKSKVTLWVHDGRDLNYEEVIMIDQENPRHEDFWDLSHMILYGRVDPTRKQGSIVVRESLLQVTKKRRIITKILTDLLMEFQGIKFTVYPSDGGYLTLQEFYEIISNK